MTYFFIIIIIQNNKFINTFSTAPTEKDKIMSSSFNITTPPFEFGFEKTDTFYQLFEFLICILERLSDEHFWNSLVSERVMNLLKKYFGSDVVFLGVIVYVARKYTIIFMCILRLIFYFTFNSYYWL